MSKDLDRIIAKQRPEMATLVSTMVDQGAGGVTVKVFEPVNVSNR